MNITQENIDELNAVLKVKVVAEDYAPKVDGALRDYQKKVKMPGFRPGKVPTGMIKKMYGRSLKLEEIQKLITDSLNNYLQENKIDYIGEPLPKADSKVDIEKQDEFEFIYELGLAPKFNVEITANDKLPYYVLKIDDKMIDDYINNVARDYGKVINSEIVGNTDYINGNFVELDANGEIQTGGIFKDGALYMEEIKDEETIKLLMGLKIGEQAILDAQKIKKNSADLASLLNIDKTIAETLTCKLQFTVKKITRMEASSIDQDLFDKVYGKGNVNSELEFRNKIKEQLSDYFSSNSDNKLHNTVVDYLQNKIQFNLPSAFLKRWMLIINEEPAIDEELEKKYNTFSEQIKWQLIENKIISENNFKSTFPEITEFAKSSILNEYARFRQEPTADELDKHIETLLKNEKELRRIDRIIVGQKVMNFYKSTFTLEIKELNSEDFFKQTN